MTPSQGGRSFHAGSKELDAPNLVPGAQVMSTSWQVHQSTESCCRGLGLCSIYRLCLFAISLHLFLQEERLGT